MNQRLLHKYPQGLFVLLLILFGVNGYCQITGSTSCNGTVGDPIVNVTFGAGPNPGPALGAAITGLRNVTAMCPSDGEYTIVNSTSSCWSGTWHTTTDHTGNQNGYFMLINASYQPSDFYVQTVEGLCDGTTYQFSAWILNMLVRPALLPDVTFTVEKTDGTVLGMYSTGQIPVINPTTWNQYGFYFTTPPGIVKVVIRMHNNAPGGNGNDLALDDIVFRPAGPTINARFTGITKDTVITCAKDNLNISLSAVVESCYLLTAYQWQLNTDNGQSWQDIIGATSRTLTRLPAPAGTYRYRLKVAQSGNIGNAVCSITSAVLTVIVKDAPAGPPAVIIATPATGLCAGAPVTFTSTATNAGDAPSFQWLVNGSPAGSNSATFIIKTLNNGDRISCVVTSNAACTTAATATSNNITVSLTPAVVAAVSITGVNNVCAGTPVTFTATGINGGTSPSYTWEVNGVVKDKGSVFTSNALMNGDVVRSVMKNNAVCATKDTSVSNNMVMNIFSLPKVTMEPGKTIFRGNQMPLTPVVTGNISSYVWTPPAGLNDALIRNPVASPFQTTAYTLKVTTTEGCTAAGSMVITVITKVEVPNVFSPNGDGIHDTWIIEGLGDYPGSGLDVFNRYGQPVYHAAGNYTPWNGQYNGRPLPAGTYYYVISLKNGFPEITGTVTIIR